VSSLFLDSVIRLEREATLEFTIKNPLNLEFKVYPLKAAQCRANIFFPIAIFTPQREAYPLSVVLWITFHFAIRSEFPSVIHRFRFKLSILLERPWTQHHWILIYHPTYQTAPAYETLCASDAIN